MSRLRSLLGVLAPIALVVAGCGGGGGSSFVVVTNASVGGIWTGTDSISGLQVTGIADEEGEFHFIRTDGVQYVGTATTSGNSLSGSYDGYTEVGTEFPDGSTHGVGNLTGTVQQRSSISANVSFKTDAGNSSSGTLSLTFNKLYNNPSALATLSGNYTDTKSGDVISVTGNGDISWQDPNTGCVGNGTVSIINVSYNAYRVQFSYASCTGQSAVLNGVTFSGLATLDSATNPQQVVAGVTGAAGGVQYAIVFDLDRT